MTTRTHVARGRRRTTTRWLIVCSVAASLLSTTAGSILAAPATRAAAARVGTSQIALAPAGVDDWAMFRHDVSHVGVSAETHLGASNSSSLNLHWSANTGGISYSSPAVVYNSTLGKSLVYVANQSGVHDRV